MELKRPSRVLLVDDHPLVHAGVAWALSQCTDLMLAGGSKTFAQAITDFEQLNPDVVVLDLRLPDGDGFDLVQRWTGRRPPAAILVFTAMEDELFAERVLRAGGRGFLQKTSDLEILLHAIREILAGKVFLSESMQQRLAGRLVDGMRLDADPLASLSDRELQVLRLMGEGKSTRQIAEHLKRSVKTIETYRDRLRKKLGLASGTELTHFAIERASRP